MRSSEWRSAVASASSRRSAPVQKTLPDDRGVLEHALLGGRESVDASGDDALQRLGEGELLRGAALETELRELLGVQRVSFRALQQGLLGLGRQQ